MEPVLIVALTALVPGASGAAVANLHAILQRLDLPDMPSDEITQQRFGTGTTRAVAHLFDRLGLGVNSSGVITEAAARKVNDALVDRELLAVVSGSVYYEDGAPAQDCLVRVDDQHNLGSIAAAIVPVDAGGRYRAYYDRRFYLRERPGIERPTDALVMVARAYDVSGALQAQSEPTPNRDGHTEIDLRIPRTRPIEGETTFVDYMVVGELLDAGGAPIAEAEIQLFDRDIGANWQQLGDEHYITNSDGAFRITYKLEQFSDADAAPPIADLMFVVRINGEPVEPIAITRLPVEGDLTVTAELPMPVRDISLGIPARRKESVRLVATGVLAKTVVEYEDLIQALAPLLRERSPADLDEARYRDISFAAREVSREFARVEALAVAWTLSKTNFNDIDPQVMYAFTRLLGIRDARTLAATPAETLITTYRQAVSEAVINDVANDINRLTVDLRKAAAHTVLTVAASGDLGALGDTFKAFVPDADASATLLQQFGDRAADIPSFWATFKTNNAQVDVPRLQLSLQLASLTNNNVELIDAIRASNREATSLRELAIDLDIDRIDTLIRDNGAPVPPPREGETPDDARKRFASGIAGVIEAAHPTAVVARLARAWSGQTPDNFSAGATQLMERIVVKTEYELGSGGFAELMTTRGAELLDGINDPDEAVSTVKRVERLYVVSAGPDVLSALVTANSPTGKPFAGAFDVARFGKRAFLANFNGAPLETQTALSAVHDSATAMMEATGSMLMGLHQAAFDPLPALITRSVDPTSVPTWAQLFGNSNMCECEECRSLWGAPAYLVNVFEFLDKRCSPNAAGVTPLDVLIGNPAKGIVGRRPDLVHIKLSCENTNTTLPTIDLINEILESQIAYATTLPPQANQNPLDITSEELAAQPQHVVSKAYQTLAKATYPISLPFSRVTTTTRAYLSQIGVSRADLIRQFGTGAGATSRLAAERLGLLPIDWQILTGKNFAGADTAYASETLYGFAVGTPDWLSRVSILAEATKRLGLTVGELNVLTKTRVLSGRWSAGARAVLDRLPIGVMTLKILREGGFASAAADLQALLDWVQLPLSDLKTWSDATTALQAQALFIDPPGELDTDKARLCHVDGSPLSADDWLKLHRFVRLSRRSGIAFHDLDLALGAVASAGAPEAQLCALADLAALKDTLGLDWSGTAVLFAEMDAQGPDSLYDRLFIRTGLARLDKIFMRASDGTVLAAAPNLAGHEKTVAAAFGWKTADIASLAQRLGITKLTLATLARLYREAALARALGLQPAEYLALTASGSPFGDPPTLAPLAAFVDTIRASGDAGKRAARAYFTTGKADNDAAGKDFAGMLKTIRAAVLAYATPPGSDPVMVDAQRRTIVKTTLAQAFKLPPAVVSKLTDTPALIHGRQAGSALSPFQRPEDDASNAAAIAVLQQIDRVGTLLSTFTLTEIDLARLGSGLGILPANLTALLTAPDQAALQKIWDRTSHYAQWRDRFPLRGALLDPAITAVAAPDSATWTDPVVAAVAALAQVQPADVLTIVTAMINVTPAVQLHTDPLATLIAIDDRLAIAKAAATAADQLAALANDLEEDDTGDAALESLMAGVRERHDPDAWLTVSQQLNDPIREKRRDALVAYLLESKGLANKDALFSEFLIDPQINAFLVTSRIANAHAVSQIFVQRIRLGLELLNPDPRLRISPAQVGPEWDTLGDFRFWQANMEVLAFTHWYLDPALRDDITPAFKDLMAFTRENEPTPNNITQALTTYVERLGEVANLEICGTFLQEDFTPDEAFKYKNVLHVIGRTRGGVQRNYYYRRLNTYAASSEWTAWEPMKLDIQAVERDRPGGRTPGKSAKPVGGVHLIPVVWKRRLHVFWPSLVRKVETPNESPAIDVKTGQSNSSPPPEYWEIKLNWSRYDNGAWLPRQVSADFHETYKTTGFAVGTGGFGSVIGAPLFFETAEFPPPQNLFLKANLSNPHELAIDLFEQASGKDALRLSTFAFDDLRASVNVRYASGNASGDHVDFVGTSRRFMGLAGQGGLAAVTTSDKPEGFTVLRRGPPRTLTPLNQYYGKPLAAPFFLTDSQRSYHVDVVPATATVQKAVSKPDQTGVGTYDPFNTDIIAKAKAIATAISTEAPSNTPWVKFQREKVQASIGPTFQSLPALDVNLVTAAAIVPETTLSASVAQPLKDFYDVIDHNYFGVGMRSVEVPSIKATFTPFFHPFADQFAMTIRKFGSEALFRESTQRLSMAGSQPFKERYDPDPQQVTNAAMVESVDFGAGTPFGVYNNELFRDFHLFVADLLLQGNHFEEAIKALGRILDPLSPVEDPQLAWKFLPFREPGQLPFDQLVQKLAATSDDPDRKALLAQIEQSRLYPYQPYRIARLRPDAMKKLVFIKTVQAWLKWGEYFHRRYDPTSLAKAFQLYLVPSAMMGRKPELMSQRTVVPAKSYAELRPRLNELGDVMLTIEEQLPALTAVTGPSTGTTTGGALMRTAATGYFCMPPDSKFLELFDLVADRLYKLRNGMTLEGVRRQPALFGPKIDPAVLVKAAASGADLQAAVDGALGTDRPHHRFHVHLRIARERVEALANIIAALLTTLEKKEAEHLQLMHATHEREMQDFIAVVKQQQINEAEQNIVALDAQRAIAAVRWENMREQLGALDEVASPELDADTGAVKANGRYAPKRLLKLVDGANLNIAIAPGDPLNAINITPISVKLQNGKILAEEQDEVVRSFEAAAVNAAESVVEGLAGVISVLPNFEGAVKPLGAGAAVHFGGVQLGAVLTAGARAMRAGATMLGFLASNAGKQASFIWRERDFAERLNTAAAEILHIDQLKRGATLHKQQMVQDRDNHIEQTTRIKAVENFLASKFTAEQLYTRIETRLVDLQKRAWSMVLDAVEQAQACYRYDWQTDPPDLPSNLWDASLRGFYSADPMRLALSQLEASYLEQARRGPELTRHFSLKDINPWALVKLRETGSCDFALDEALFDLDNPGHYFRRIHSVAISIAGVTGPYTPVNATLRQNSNAVRIKVETTPTSTSYPRTGDGDERFKTISLPFEQMMVCSTGREDTGMFDTSFTDDRYRPFEGTGAISDWTLSLPRDFPLFDYRTISNVVIHIRYTARDGGAMLTSAATGALRKAFNEIRHEAAKTGIYRLISLRHDRQDDWHRFRGATAPTTLQVEREVLPHQFRDIAKRAETGSAMLIVKRDSEANVANATSVELDSDANEAWTVTIPPPTDDAIEDIYLLLKFTLPDA